MEKIRMKLITPKDGSNVTIGITGWLDIWTALNQKIQIEKR